MTHTPTPWETRELSNGDWAISQKGAPTAHTTVHTWNGKEERATAQFIVQACNAHDELVAALKEIVLSCEDGELGEYSTSGDWYTEAKRAIAKAKGK